jgi:ferredoxin--NADP+ reductase
MRIDPCLRAFTGTLVSDNLIDGRHPCLIGAGTGLAPLLSVIKDPQTYWGFEKDSPTSPLSSRG